MASEKGSIGFIGLGLMGQAITKRLVACGYEVTGYDIVPEKVTTAAAEPAGCTPWAAAAVTFSDTIS